MLTAAEQTKAEGRAGKWGALPFKLKVVRGGLTEETFDPREKLTQIWRKNGGYKGPE